MSSLPIASGAPVAGSLGRRRHRRTGTVLAASNHMIRKLPSGKYRLYSRKQDAKTGKRKNLGTFPSRAAAEKHERAVQFFKHGGRKG